MIPFTQNFCIDLLLSQIGKLTDVFDKIVWLGVVIGLISSNCDPIATCADS